MTADHTSLKHKLFQNFLQFKKGQVRNKRNPRKWEGKNTHNSKGTGRSLFGDGFFSKTMSLS